MDVRFSYVGVAEMVMCLNDEASESLTTDSRRSDRSLLSEEGNAIGSAKGLISRNPLPAL
jgi:hypothetical protein